MSPINIYVANNMIQVANNGEFHQNNNFWPIKTWFENVKILPHCMWFPSPLMLFDWFFESSNFSSKLLQMCSKWQTTLCFIKNNNFWPITFGHHLCFSKVQILPRKEGPKASLAPVGYLIDSRIHHWSASRPPRVTEPPAKKLKSAVLKKLCFQQSSFNSSRTVNLRI
jgi:hypothetical protein